jgi:hypothetical protein
VNYEKALRELVEFINSQTRRTDLEMGRLRTREPEIERMGFQERLEYLQAVAEARGKMELLQAVKDFYDALGEGQSSWH